MPAWLWRSIVAVAASIVILSGGQWAACRFYVLPSVWPWYAKYSGTAQSKSIDPQPMGCNDADNKAITALLGVLTTLISLSRRAE